ncbi:hypothetical protein [Comamonas sp.]|uniref:hypothetical protein n=1 Tax=Comamonas sp. TaxID=34028 RepID=UPI0028A0ADB6|nr:hypothetical protein [Comamonas sp.]
MAKNSDDLNNSPPLLQPSTDRIEEHNKPLKRRGRPTTSRGEKCRSALSFSLLKIDLKMSWRDLEAAYLGQSTTLNNALQNKQVTGFHGNLNEQGTFLRYGSGRQTPRGNDSERLVWAKKHSVVFTEMYDSVLFDFLDLDANDESARIQFACWLWRTTIRQEAGPLDAQSLKTSQQWNFHRRMQTFTTTPRHYGECSVVNAKQLKSLPSFHGRKFDPSVIKSFSPTQRSAPSWVIPPPYQDAQQLKELIELDHPDALCIMLLGVKYPGTQPDIRELAIEGCETWLARWLMRYPGLGKGLQVFFDTLGSQVEELKPFFASYSTRMFAK